MKLINKEANLLGNPSSELESEMRRTRITRIMPADYFLDMVLHSRNTLGTVSSWQDVYECFVARVKFNGVDTQSLLDGFYGQCWSLRTEESELLWNARTQDGKYFRNDVVMVETTIYDLARSLWDSVVKGKGKHCITGFIRLGTVNYSRRGAKVSQEDVRFALSGFPNLMDSLFTKRHQFSDEKELRLIVHVKGDEQKKWVNYSLANKLLSYSINPTIIKRVVCHPMMSDLRVAQIKEQLLFRFLPVMRSSLYALPSTVFRRI